MGPSQPLPIGREPYRLELVHWGPAKGHGAGINVRVATVARAAAYRESFCGLSAGTVRDPAEILHFSEA
jgi:hypothetical protein